MFAPGQTFGTCGASGSCQLEGQACSSTMACCNNVTCRDTATTNPCGAGQTTGCTCFEPVLL